MINIYINASPPGTPGIKSGQASPQGDRKIKTQAQTILVSEEGY